MEKLSGHGQSQNNDGADEAPGCAMFAMSTQGEIQDANRAAVGLTGYAIEDLHAMRVQDLLMPGLVERQANGEIVAEGTTKNVLLRRKDGAVVAVEWSTSTLHLGGQEVVLAAVHVSPGRNRPESPPQNTVDHLQLAINTAKLGIWRLDMQTGLLTWNDELLEIYGLSRQEFEADPRRWRDQVHPDDASHVHDQLEGVYRGQQMVDLMFRVIRTDGQIRYVNASAAPHYDGEQNLIELIGINLDVTAQKRVEAALTDQEQRLQLVLEGAELGYWDWNISTGEVTFSERWAELLGYTTDELRPHLDSWSKLIHPDDLPYVMDVLNRHLRGESSYYETEHRLLTKDGGWCWVLDRGKVMTWDRDGQPLRAAGTHLDISARKQTEQRLIESEQRFRSLMQQSPSGIAIYDTDGTLREVNKALVEQYGQTFDTFGRLIGRLNILQSTSLSALQPILKRVFAGEAVVLPDRRAVSEEILAELGLPAGHRVPWVRSSLYPITDGQGAVCSIAQVNEDVTEQVHAGQALRESQEIFEKIFRYHPTPMQILSIETGERIDTNDRYVEAFGYQRDDPIKNPLNPESAWVLESQRQEARQALLEHRHLEDFPAQFVTKSGEIKDLLVSAAMLEIGEGDLAVASYVDVTERKRAQEALHSAQERYEKAFHSSPIAMNVVNILTGERYEVNERYLHLTGYSREEISQHTLASLNMFADPESRSATVARLLSDRQLQDQPVQVFSRSGERKDLLLSASMMDLAEDGLAILSWLDVTERNRAEALLRQRSQAIEQSPVSVVITDRQGTIQYVNPRFCEVTGYNAEEAIGQNPRILKSGVHSSEFYTDLWQTIRSGRAWHGEMCNKKKNGELYWELVSISGVKDVQGEITHYVAVKEDVTDRRRADEQNARQDRLAAVGQLAAGIAHDFNNILGVIVIYAQMISRSEETPERFRERAGIIHQQANHASKLIEQILDFSRHSNREKQPLNLVPLLKEHVKLLERILPENIEIQLNHTDQDLMLNADPTGMQQVLTNLVLNARDAMPRGGALHVDVCEEWFDEGDILPIVGMASGGWLKLSVRDTGTGMSAEVLKRIFDPFFTTKERGLGTGLGLAQVYGIVKQHDGHIDVKSQEGDGATFSLFFPPLHHPAASTANQGDADNSPQGTGQRILLVEDDSFLRMGLADLLTSCNYSVVTASNGIEAMSLLADQDFRVDLVLSDMIMPKMGGTELFEHISQTHPKMPVIFISGHLDKDAMKKLEVLGVTKWLSKPFDPWLIVQAVDELIGSKTG